MIGNLLAWLAQSTLLAGLAALLPRVLRVRSPGLRLVFWQAALALVVLLPLLQPWHQASMPEPAVAVALGSAGHVPPSPAADLSAFWLPAILVSGALFRLLWLGLGMTALAGFRANARSVVPPVTASAVMVRLGVRPMVAESDRVSAPVTFGWRRPTILLPRGFTALDEETRSAALCHELVHVARRDAPVVVAEEVVRALAWFHPGVWLLLARIALAREQIVDRRAVALLGDRRAYLESLYRLACARRSPALALPFGSRGHLLARIRLLTKEIIMTRSRFLLAAFALASLTGAATFLTTATFPLMATASAVDEPVYAVEGDVQPPKRLAGEPPVYPEDAKKDRVVGKVVLRTVIDRTGAVDQVEVVSSVDERLARAATDAVRTWHFSPGSKQGEPVNVYYSLTINFRLDKDERDDGGR